MLHKSIGLRLSSHYRLHLLFVILSSAANKTLTILMVRVQYWESDESLRAVENFLTASLATPQFLVGS